MRKIIKSVVSFKDTLKPTIIDRRIFAEIVINAETGMGYIKADTGVSPECLILALLSNREFYKLNWLNRKIRHVFGKGGNSEYFSVSDRTLMNGEFCSMQSEYIFITEDMDDDGYATSIGPLSCTELKKIVERFPSECFNAEDLKKFLFGTSSHIYRYLAKKYIDLSYHLFEEI